MLREKRETRDTGQKNGSEIAILFILLGGSYISLGRKGVVGSIVGIAICYELDGSGLERGVGKRFSLRHIHPDRLWGPIQDPTPWVSGIPSGGKTDGVWL
jgi:hypothetical protein